MSAVFTALIFFSGVSSEAAPPTRNPAGSSSTYIKVAGVNYVDARVFFARNGFKGAWIERGKSLRFQSATSQIDIEADKRDAVINGLRVLMGEPAVFRGSTLYVSRIDADKLFLPILRPSSVTTPPAPALRVIVIDAGHGGQDTGTQNKPFKLDEKVFALDVAMRLRTLLVKQGYKIVMTRTDDRFVPLPQRAEIANKAGADLFISIHFNAVGGSPTVRGSETYVMTPQYQRSTGSPRRDPSDNVANPGNRNDPWNTLLGYHMHDQVVGKLGSLDRGFKRARFAVLRLVNSPGVLIEAGYLSNNDEAKRISTSAYRQSLAEALAQGVRAYAVAITPVKTK
ncbi:N-acetylmuramoyl-L-alanine amidase family protein [Rariglobus hedericola]|nr:N-acetylmuramoyl-L-alanine amidase [Rariglobus hedericola]